MPTYSVAGWKENKIDYRNCVSSTGDDEVAASRNKPTLTVLTGAPMQLGSAGMRIQIRTQDTKPGKQTLTGPACNIC
jgi:hypothetical protein